MAYKPSWDRHEDLTDKLTDAPCFGPPGKLTLRCMGRGDPGALTAAQENCIEQDAWVYQSADGSPRRRGLTGPHST